MPDFDGQKREGEDEFIEPKTDDSEDKSHIIVPVSEGKLEISSEKAILHTSLYSMGVFFRINGNVCPTKDFSRSTRWEY